MQGSKERKFAPHNGKPIRATMLPYGHQCIEEDDILAVSQVLRSDWITTGPKVAEFENAFAIRTGARFAVSFSSGTAALHGAVFAAGLTSSNEAITTPMTFCATANCVLYQGADPIFADVCHDTLNIDPTDITKRNTPRTKAILAVDYAGHPADLDQLREICTLHGLVLVEDASHALGAEYGPRQVGSVSDMTVFSFHPVKHITTGEGGMVTTNSEEFARLLRIFRNHGIDSEARQRQARNQWYYEMVALGYNYRLPDIACALGLSQLRRLDANLARRREIAARYTEAFRDQAGVITPSVRPNVKPSWHIYPIQIDLTKLRASRDEVFRALRAQGIGVSVHYIPVHLHPYYRDRFGHHKGEYPVAEAAYERLITLPLFHCMSDDDVEDVINALTGVAKHYAA
jgi:perosamine synthetase